jgi:DNA-binding transcriptional ArsR family regulator
MSRFAAAKGDRSPVAWVKLNSDGGIESIDDGLLDHQGRLTEGPHSSLHHSMSALPVNVVEFQLPKRKPKIIEKAGNPDQRTYAVVPLRALRDKRLTSGDIRVLGIMASYANRAGLTWVGQRRMGEDLQVSQQAISKHVKRLTELGYLEMVSNAFRGEKAVTRRIIFDDTIKAVDAVAITSSIEDTRVQRWSGPTEMEGSRQEKDSRSPSGSLLCP